MPKHFAVVTIALLAGLMFSPALYPQAATPTQSGEGKVDKWNSDPFNGNGRAHPAFVPAKEAPAPPRDLSGIWDTTVEGVQAAGALEHEAVYPKEAPGSEAQVKRFQGGQPNEKGVVHPLPYTPLGEAALEANKPTGQSVRSVSSALGNDPINICNPIGFPYMVNYEMLTIELVQTKNQVLYLNEFRHNWRIIWTDGRALPKNPEPRWNGYSVGHWEDDYTFVVETVGMNEKSWLDHAGRPHSSDLRVKEIFHRVDDDTMEHTEIIDDPKMYTEPWMAHNKLILHRQPPDFDIREYTCSPSDIASYDKILGNPPEKK